jgi:alpha-tubulin suppressor-like RCC1 family protein
MACSSDFPNESDQAVVLEAIDWPNELHVSDVDTIEIQVRLRDSPQTITGLRVRWQSRTEDVLRVVELEPPEGASRDEALMAQRRAEVTALSGGADTVSVVVEVGGGFEPAEFFGEIAVTQKWASVSAGRTHTCGTTVDSRAYCWGEGDAGKLGNGRPLASTSPVQALGFGDLRFSAVIAGDESSCGIIDEGLAYCWGSNDEGRLGNGDQFERSQLLPTAVIGPTFGVLDVGRVGCGLGADSTVHCWGGNADHQLGRRLGDPPPLDICLNNNPEGCSRVPLPVSSNTATPESYGSVTVGGHHTCALSRTEVSGLAFCWGNGPRGALGSDTTTNSLSPIPVTGERTFAVISAGGDHTCGVTTSGDTFCWGSNTDGQLGNGTVDDLRTPTALTPGTFDSVTAGGRHTCALTSTGEAFCWGSGSLGQLGNGSSDRALTPVAVSDGLRFESLSAGDSHTCGVVLGGSLYCWGNGAGGRLGAGDEGNRLTPSRVVEP